MTKSVKKTKLLVLGVHLNSEGYPNIRYRIQDLTKTSWLDTTEINVSMWKKNIPSKHNKIHFISSLFRAVYAHLSVTIRYLLHGRTALVYIPYPSVFIVFILSILPRALKPDKIVVDAFISLYDTVVNDRKLLSSRNWVSILLKRIEKRSYSYADFIIVDTPQNASHFCSEFSLSASKVIDIPLSTNEENFQIQHYKSNSTICRVLFVGTFIPLHGISAIITAANRLKDCPNILFRIVGTGQTAAEIENAIQQGATNLEWIKTWQTSETLARMIRESDICLGIFGASEKTQRVCPLKLYAYAACGRAIITGDTEWSRYVEKNLSYMPFETVAVNNGDALEKKIRKLSGSLECRQQLAKNSRRFYDEQLCNNIAISRLNPLLSLENEVNIRNDQAVK